ncbi:hypothetical protein D3C81_466890 [compost metagenome]
MKILKNIIICLTTISACSCSLYPESTYKSKTRTNYNFPELNDKSCSFNSLTGKSYKKDLNNKECKERVFYSTTDYSKTIAVLEIDEQGRFVDEEHINRILEFIKNREKPIVSLYIHGWNHNSRISDSDLHAFQTVVNNLHDDWKETESDENKKQIKRDSVGIYIAWRGRVFPKWANYVTFWNRKSVSISVGRSDLTRFILQLEQNVKARSQNKNGTLILMGHSFGASALYNAISPTLITRFYDSLTEQQTNPDVPLKGVGDLVVLMNPAIEAKQFVALREAVWQEGVKNNNIFKNNPRPIFMMFGSNSDGSLNNAFPTGRYLNTVWFNKYTNTTIVDGNSLCNNKPCLTENGINKPLLLSVQESKMDRRAIGNYEWFYTHWLAFDQEPKLPKQKLFSNNDFQISSYPTNKCQIEKNWLEKAYKNDNHQWVALPSRNTKNDLMKISTQFIPIDGKYEWRKTGIHRRPEPQKATGSRSDGTTWNYNPYWFIRTNGSVIPGHNGIWKAGVGCFILSTLKFD